MAQSCPTLCDPMDYIVHGILQAIIPEWVAFPFSRGSSQPRSPALPADSLPVEPQGKPKNTGVRFLSLLWRTFPSQEVTRGVLRCRRVLYQGAVRGFLRPSTNSFVISMSAMSLAPSPHPDCRCSWQYRTIALTAVRDSGVCARDTDEVASVATQG